MILDGFNNQPVDKIISVPGPQGPPGLSGITQNLRRPQRNTLAAVGDSMVAKGSVGDAANRPPECQSFLQATSFQMLPILTHQRIKYSGGNFAVSSSPVSAQVTQLQNVLSMNPLPGACLLACNSAEIVNNLSYSFTANQVLLKSMVASLLAAGVVPILWCVVPITSNVFTVDKATINVRLNQWNVWIRRYAAQNGFPLIDAHSALAQVDGTFISGMSDDNLHPNAKGHTLIAQQAIADGLADIFPPNSLVNTARTTDDLTTLFNSGTINYGLFTADSNSDGAADGLTLSGTATKSLVAPLSSDNLLGNWQQLTVTAGNTASLSAVISSGWSVGDTLAFCCRVQTQNMATSGAAWTVGAKMPGSFTLSDGTTPTVLWGGIYNWTSGDVSDGEVYVEFTVPTGTTQLAFYGWIESVASGSATLRFGEVTLRNLTQGGFLV